MSNPFEDLQTKQIPLRDKYINGVDPEEQELLLPHIETLKEILRKVKNGERVYLGITTGERKGSIAYIHSLDPDYLWRDQDREPKVRHSNVWGSNTVRVDNNSLYVILRWDKRRNKIKWSTGGGDTVYLPDYEGPTVWQKVDKKKLAKETLKKRKVKDREGNVLEVGDRVVYINARYGSGARLDRGTISDIKMHVDVQGENKYVTTHVIIDNDDGNQSDIRNPDLAILRASSPMELMSNQVLDF